MSAFFANAAYLHYSGVYKTVRGEHELHIHPESVVALTKQPKWYTELSTNHHELNKIMNQNFIYNVCFSGWFLMKCYTLQKSI